MFSIYYNFVSRLTYYDDWSLLEYNLGDPTKYIEAHTNHNKKSIRSTHVFVIFFLCTRFSFRTRKLFKVIISFTGFLYKQYVYYNNVFYLYVYMYKCINK